MLFLPNVAFLTGSVGTGEWIVLFVVILIVVGPKRLPEVVRKIGRTMEMFRRAADEFKDQLMTMDQDSPPSSPPSEEAPPTDADGVAGTSPAGSEPVSGEGSSGNAYPDVADYPGNENQVENWSLENQVDPSVSGAQPPSSDPSDAATADKPPEGGA